jgi:Fe2+ transport system protein FeoA
MLNIHFWRNTQPISANGGAKTRGAGCLSQTPSGTQVTITSLGELPPAQRQHLQAYGLMPGRSVQVLAQQPVTIILVEQTELAFETEIARQITVE